MNGMRAKKYGLFLAILLFGVFLDQWSKWYAQRRLANARLGEGHAITITVPRSSDGATLREYLAREFSANREPMIDWMARKWVVGPDGRRLQPEETVEADEVLEVMHRTVTVIPGYFDFEYAENRGAAFSFLADSDSPWRLPFLIGFSILALGVVVYLLRDIDWRHKLMILSLSFIATGAVGNLIDRIRLGYVIDFILWKYTDQYRWPNFNIADMFISVGVTLMLIELFREALAEVDSDPAEEQG